MKRSICVLGACLALGLTACGDDEEDAASTPAPAAAPATSGDTVAVGMKDLKFDPEKVAVKVGQKVVWTNNESIPHNVIANEGADFESSTFGEGGTYEYVADKVGLIKYECTLHPGMVGELDVK